MQVGGFVRRVIVVVDEIKPARFDKWTEDIGIKSRIQNGYVYGMGLVDGYREHKGSYGQTLENQSHVREFPENL